MPRRTTFELPPRRTYHVSRTPEPLQSFLPMSHFGTAKAALDRARGITVQAAGAATLHEVELEVRRGLRIGEADGIGHTWLRLVDMLHYETRAITSADREAVFAAAGPLDGTGDRAAFEAIAAILRRKGYDSMCYTNWHEDFGRLSWISLDATQVRILRAAPVADVIAEMEARGTLPERGCRTDPDGSASDDVVAALDAVLDRLAVPAVR